MRDEKRPYRAVTRQIEVRVEPQFLAGTKPTKHDVGTDAAIAIIADGFLLFSSFNQCHRRSIRQTCNRQVPRRPALLKHSVQILYITFHMIICIFYVYFYYLI